MEFNQPGLHISAPAPLNDTHGINKKEEPSSKKLHEDSDLDKSRWAQHHSLGNDRTQAAAGDHIHNGENGKKLGQGMSLVLTGSKGGNVALTNLINMLKNFIEFTDNTT